MKMERYSLCITNEEYSRFRTHKATRLYDHKMLNGELTVWSSNPRKLADDLETVIDFGATSADSVLIPKGEI